MSQARWEAHLFNAAARSPAVEVVPVLHVRRGRLVSPDGTPYPERPLDALARISGEAVYIVDMEGIERNKPDHALLQAVAKRRSVWSDAGPRYATDAADALVAGADRVTVRWNTLASEGELRELVALSDSAFLGIEFRRGLVPNRRDPAASLRKLFALATELGIGVVGVDLDSAGTMRGVNKALAAELQPFPGEKYFAGGVRSLGEAEELGLMGFAGALVSTAVLAGGLQP